MHTLPILRMQEEYLDKGKHLYTMCFLDLE